MKVQISPRRCAIALTGIVATIALAAMDAGGTEPRKVGTDSIPDFYDSLYAGESVPDTLHVSGRDAVPFGVGEKLRYSIQYGLIKAGKATLEVRNLAEIDSAWCYRIVSNSRTSSFFSKIYKVRDRYESYMDTTELYSRRYEKHIREGKYRKDEVVRFDQKKHVAMYANKSVPIAPRTQDVLSALYYVRTLPLEVGQSIAVPNHTDGRNYPLVIRVHRRERVTVEAGTFDCLVVEPILRGPGLFSQKGRLTVWVTDDTNKIPVLMRSKMVIGHVSAVLKDYKLSR